MKKENMAKILGSRGGKARAKKLSAARRKEIASSGAKARIESLRIAKEILVNFKYLESFREFAPPTKKVRSVSKCNHKLPGIYV